MPSHASSWTRALSPITPSSKDSSSRPKGYSLTLLAPPQARDPLPRSPCRDIVLSTASSMPCFISGEPRMRC
eukprot:2782453-Rhodomonas_salina.1